MGLDNEFWTVLSAIGAVCASAFTGILAAYALIQTRDNRKSSERQLRAYVLIDSAEFFQVSGRWMAILKIRNFGHTPAYNLMMTLETEWRDRSDILVKLSMSDRKYVHPKTIIAPGHPVNTAVDVGGLTFDPADWSILASDNHRPFIWGRLDYTDAFDYPRWTVFQLYSDLDGIKTLANCAVGNDAN